MIVNTVSEIVLAHERQRAGRAGAIDNGRDVSVAVKTAAVFDDVVGDHHVEIFLVQFFLRVGNQIFGLGGEADEPFAVLILTQLFQNIRAWLEAQLDRTPTSLDFPRPSSRRSHASLTAAPGKLDR